MAVGTKSWYAFQLLKNSLCIALVLMFLDSKPPYTVVIDASGTMARRVFIKYQRMNYSLLIFLVGNSSLWNKDIALTSDNWQ